MNKISNKDILSRLSLHVKAFQEGFEILSGANSFTKLGENFNRILGGSLLIVDVSLFHKQSIDDEWKPISVQNSKSYDFVNLIDGLDEFKIVYTENEYYKIAAFIPLVDGTFCGLLLGPKYDKSEFSDSDKIALQMFFQLLDNSYQSLINSKKEKQLQFMLNHKVLQLNSLVDTGIEISKLEKRFDLFELALERVVTLTNASKGVIKVYKDDKLINSFSLPAEIDIEKALKSEIKIQSKVNFKNYLYEFTLLEKESRDTFIEFDSTDEILLDAFAKQVLTAIENEQHHKESLETETIKRELSVASSIQRKIIPDALPTIPGYEMAGINIPSKEVGGDYYDCQVLDDGRYALIIADVAGKGVAAALLVSTLDASLRSYLDMKIPLSELAIKINKLIYNASPPDKFITFFISIIDPATGEMDIINAGHNPSLILKSDGSIKEIEAGGVAFGMFDMGLPFDGEKIILEPGERLLLFTDGIPEAMDEGENEYTDERLNAFFQKNTPVLASEFIDALVSDVKLHTKETAQSDDITALYIIRQK